MAELEIKSCGWKLNHEPHHVVQHSQDSFNCPGYDFLTSPDSDYKRK